jgi:transcriptional regulator with XRE-family HTH domain
MGNPKPVFDHEPQAVTWARKQAGLTKSDVARRLGVSLALVSMIESGTRNAHPAMIARLAEVFGCSGESLERKDGRPGTRLATVCVGCSSLWEPGHECPPQVNGAAA